MKRCPNSLSLRRFSGLLASFLTSSVSFFPWGLWAKSLARLNSDAIVRSLREDRGPRPSEGADRRRQLLGIAHFGILPISPKGHATSPHQPIDKPDQPDYLPTAGPSRPRTAQPG